MSADLIPVNTPLEVDPVQHMSVFLHRATGWLAPPHFPEARKVAA